MIERVRTLGASLDGSLLDDATWRVRHRSVLLCASILSVFITVSSLSDPDGSEEWAYVAIVIGMATLAAVPAWSRRSREVLVAVCFMAGALYMSRFVGNFTLGPLMMIVLSFYQDWLPIAVGCAETVAVLVLAWVHPAFFSGSAAFAPESPGPGITLRTSAILLAAVLSLAIWRAGTQLSRDQLTGMLSRLGVERILDREIARGRRPAVWVCDLDNFGAINRQLGARTGDSVLRQVAKRLRRTAGSLPGGSLTARLGGDTFLIADRDAVDVDVVEDFAHRIESEVGAGVSGPAGPDVPVRLSVGAAIASPGETAANLVLAAERNMRAAKGRGTVRVVVDRSSERLVDNNHSLLSTELYEACERGELELYIQPIVALADGLPVGGETLARWKHPQRGLVYPGEFLPEAEQDSALMAVISNNLGEVFHDLVVDFAGRYGPDVSEVLGAFRDAGYHLALDDFGIGHSSLAHLREFPLDTVKLDMSFVQSMGRSPIDRAVVEAVADIASASGLKVIAEGVETAEQRDMLLAIKPDMLAQGWLYARAMPPDAFEAWVLDRKRAAVA